MVSNTIRGVLLFSALALVGVSVSAADAPTLHQVYEAAQAGRLDQAQAMMDQVLKAHPNSAKAHYVGAEILLKQGRLAKAREALQTAQSLAPGLPFAKPQSVRALESKLQAGSSSASLTSATPASSSSAIPWSGLLIGAALLFLLVYLVRSFASRRAAGYMPTAPGAQTYPGGAAGPLTSAGGGMGSNIVSGLVTGAAVGAGMVAGGALAHRFMDGDGSAPQSPLADNSEASGDSLGGDNFGVADNTSWDDNGGDIADLGGGDWS